MNVERTSVDVSDYPLFDCDDPNNKNEFVKKKQNDDDAKSIKVKKARDIDPRVWGWTVAGLLVVAVVLFVIFAIKLM